MASPAASLPPTVKLEAVAQENSLPVQGQPIASVASPSSAFVAQVRTVAAALFLAMGDGKDESSNHSTASLPTNASWSEPSDTSQSSITPGSPSTIEDDEFEPDDFEPSDFDAESLHDSTSVGSSVYGHSYRNGRRYHKARNNRSDKNDSGYHDSDLFFTG
ncbi:S-adenosyl-L-methionine-dependent methyltransferase [Apiospora aurea]|uniref:S-adenosyl-L-methionine-dependent methyltransferase n=1 Tax=Apiospora aurea TaxID=335848 RepID=A0ABR1QPR9_9PEZI